MAPVTRPPSSAFPHFALLSVWLSFWGEGMIGERSVLSPLQADAIDTHRSLSDKHGLAGKRELQPEEEAKPGSLDRSLPESNIVRTLIEFLTFLHLKEAGALHSLAGLPPEVSSEDTEQS
uniref:Galanin peptides n=1 Tax=Urocitellus parryii TaxID=9999 RepID=A0A8D2H5U1_UROPR